MTPMTPKQKRILDFITGYTNEHGYAPSQQEIADAFGYRSLGTVQNYLTRLEKEGALTRCWNHRRSLQATTPQRAEPAATALSLPLAGRVAAGQPIEAISNPDQFDVPAAMVGDGEHFCLRVQGESMIEDGILDGDYVVVRQQSQATNGHTVVAVVNNEATIKRFYQHNDQIELKPANATMPSLFYRADQVQINGRVVGVIRYCR